MGDADEGLGSLPGALPPQLGDPVLGDHVVDVILAGRHMGARRQGRDDARDAVLLGGGR